MHKLSLILCLTLLAVVSACPDNDRAYGLEDAIIAIVDDEIITFKDLKDYLNSIYVQLKIEGRPPHEIERIMVDSESRGVEQLIIDRLILNEANRKKLEVNTKAVDDKLAAIKAKYPDEDAFLQALLSDGATITDLRKKLEDQLKISHLVDYQIKSKISVNPQEVTEYYEAHQAEFKRPHRVNLDSLFTANREKAEEALKLIKEGSDFMEVAKKYSEAPSVGVIAQGQLLPEIEESLFKLQIGEVSEIYQVVNGYFIFQIKGRIASETAPLEEVKDDITRRVFNQKFKKKFDAWVKDLKKDAFIEINTD